jgi:hypothetical protein
MRPSLKGSSDEAMLVSVLVRIAIVIGVAAL